jgi:hypothetical protein
MTHFCDKTMFFPWVPFIQMFVMTNISLNLVIGSLIKINNFIMKRTMGLFMD